MVTHLQQARHEDKSMLNTFWVCSAQYVISDTEIDTRYTSEAKYGSRAPESKLSHSLLSALTLSPYILPYVPQAPGRQTG